MFFMWFKAGINASPASGLFWTLLGNSGTVDGTNFLGTTDNVVMNFRVNNVKAGRIDHILHNTFFGYQSGLGNTVGADCVFIGDEAGKSNTVGNRLVFIGSEAGKAFAGNPLAVNAQDNVGVGYRALASLTTDYANTAVGWSALAGLLSGVSNSAFGSGAGSLVTTGQSLTLLGASADVTVGTESNSIALGYGAIIAANNEMVVAGSGSFITKVRWTYSGGGAQHQEFFRTATPEGAQIGTRGDIAYVNDGATGSVFVKATGAATNTGWLQLATGVGSQWTSVGSDIFFNGGTVGIGGAAPPTVAFAVRNGASKDFFSVNTATGVVRLGDLGGAANNTILDVDDNSQTIKATAVNGYGINQTPTVNSPLAIAGETSYANDAAAIGAGLVSGETYRHTAGGITTLCIVP